MKRASGIVTDYGGRTSPTRPSSAASWASPPSSAPATRPRRSRRPGGHPLVRGGRHGLRLRRALDYEREEVDLETSPETDTQDHDEHRQPRGRAALVERSRARHRPGANGVHHQQHHQGPPLALARFDEVEDEEAAIEALIERPHRGLRGQGRSTSSSTSPAGIATIAASSTPNPGHRAHERLQDQRVRRPDRREQDLRAHTKRRTRCWASAGLAATTATLPRRLRPRVRAIRPRRASASAWTTSWS